MDIAQPFGRRQNRHCGGNHRVAIKQRGCKHAEHDNRSGPACTRRLTIDQREQGKAAAFALVIGLHDGHRIFEGNHDHHRPKYEAQHADDMQWIGCNRVMPGKGFAECVNRAGTNIAEDNANGTYRELRRRTLRCMAMPVTFLIRVMSEIICLRCDHSNPRLLTCPAMYFNRAGSARYHAVVGLTTKQCRWHFYNFALPYQLFAFGAGLLAAACACNAFAPASCDSSRGRHLAFGVARDSVFSQNNIAPLISPPNSRDNPAK